MANKLYTGAFILFALSITLHAQSSNYSYLLERGRFFNKVAWRDSMYRFADFKTSYINFDGPNSKNLKALMNYNLFLGRMELISETGDTITLQNFHNIKFINIGDKTFYNHKAQGYLELAQAGKLNVGIKHWLKVVMESGTGEKFVIVDNGLRETSTRYDRTYTKEKIYYLIDDDLKIHRPTLRVFSLLLPGHKEEITAYFRKNKFDLRKEGDFLMMLNYCKKITAAASASQ